MKKLPIGIHDFKEIIDNDYYYVDKTMFITHLISEYVSIYTSPKCFGKTLNMSMLYYFFSNKESENAYLFDGLKVANYPEVMKHQNQYPTILINLSDMTGKTIDDQKKIFTKKLVNIIKAFPELTKTPDISDMRKREIKKYIDGHLSEIDLHLSLNNFTYYLEMYYHKKAIILLDDYDTPLQTALLNGYYDDMQRFLRQIFGCAFKGNNSLRKVILTGTLRFNNDFEFNNYSLSPIFYRCTQDIFGYKENEVKQILSDYHMLHHFEEVKEWYGGYTIDNTEMYNTLSLFKYIQSKESNENTKPQAYLEYTIDDDIIYNYIQKQQLPPRFFDLIHGKSIHDNFYENMTHKDIELYFNGYMFFIGYLTIKSIADESSFYFHFQKYEPIACNKEVRYHLQSIIYKYFIEYRDSIQNNLYQYLLHGDTEKLNDIFSEALYRYMLIVKYDENYHHQFLIETFHNYKIEFHKENHQLIITISPKDNSETIIILECLSFQDIYQFIDYSDNNAKHFNDKEENKRLIKYKMIFHERQCELIKSI